MFRRRQKQRGPEDGDVDGELELDVAHAGADETGAEETGAGPYDATAPDDGLARVDLGGLQIPVLEGMELRVEVDEAGQVIAATLVEGPSIMQLGAFAAPKTSGIWEEVRAEISESIRSGGGSVEEADGPYGIELRTSVPTEVPGQLAPARFVGIDGPRWFLRALFSGAAGADQEAAKHLDKVLRGLVVVRGGDAMPIRDPIPLRLPEEAVAAAAAEADPEQQPSLDPFERGPEITEVR